MAALLGRLWFLPGPWIDPDEGAHLMNGLLVLGGYTPEVDFGGRQPFHGYFLAFVLHLVGGGCEGARLSPVPATVAAGGVVYLVAELSAWAFRPRHPVPVAGTSVCSYSASKRGAFLARRAGALEFTVVTSSIR